MIRTKEEIEKEILIFLDENSTKKTRPGTPCTLATCVDNIPRAIPMSFYIDGLTLWMSGDPGGKMENIRTNPNVSVAIYSPHDRSKENRSIMLRAKASLVTYHKQEELYMEVITKFGILDSLKQAIQSGLIDKQTLLDVALGEDVETKLDKMLHRQTLIKVEPEIISLLILPPGGIVERLVWEKEL
jgi:hypothetical protein